MVVVTWAEPDEPVAGDHGNILVPFIDTHMHTEHLRRPPPFFDYAAITVTANILFYQA